MKVKIDAYLLKYDSEKQPEILESCLEMQEEFTEDIETYANEVLDYLLPQLSECQNLENGCVYHFFGDAEITEDSWIDQWSGGTEYDNDLELNEDFKITKLTEQEIKDRGWSDEQNN